MNRHLLLLAISFACCLASSPAAEPVVKDYFVSKAGNDQALLARVFDKVAAMEIGEKPSGRDFEVIRRIDEKQFIVCKRAKRAGPDVTDRLARIGGYVGRRLEPSYENFTDYSISYWLISRVAIAAADGEIIRGCSATDSSEMKQFGTATYRIIRIEAAPPAPVFTRENFLFHLKAGRTWFLPRFLGEKCGTCFGDGKLGALRKDAKCPDCQGKGQIVSDLNVRW